MEQGLIAEMVSFGKPLSAEERNAVTEYFRRKYQPTRWEMLLDRLAHWWMNIYPRRLWRSWQQPVRREFPSSSSLTFANAVIILNSVAHDGYDNWYIRDRWADTPDDDYVHLSEFEAIAIADKYLRDSINPK